MAANCRHRQGGDQGITMRLSDQQRQHAKEISRALKIRRMDVGLTMEALTKNSRTTLSMVTQYFYRGRIGPEYTKEKDAILKALGCDDESDLIEKTKDAPKRRWKRVTEIPHNARPGIAKKLQNLLSEYNSFTLPTLILPCYEMRDFSV